VGSGCQFITKQQQQRFLAQETKGDEHGRGGEQEFFFVVVSGLARFFCGSPSVEFLLFLLASCFPEFRLFVRRWKLAAAAAAA
jgi:hypothetical protein